MVRTPSSPKLRFSDAPTSEGAMTMMRRTAPICGTTALLALVFAFQGCATDNTGSTGSGGTTGSGTGGVSTATGGITGSGTGGLAATAGTTGAAGASATAGTAGAAGASGGFGSPACGNTMAGLAAGKGVAC